MSIGLLRHCTRMDRLGAPRSAHLPSASSLMIDAFGLLSLTELVTSLTRNGGLDR